MSEIKDSILRQVIISSLKSKDAQSRLFQKTLRVIRYADGAEEALDDVEEMHETQKHNKKLHAKMWSYLSYSISQTFPNTELRATSYKRRSEFYFHLNKYDACIHDVEKAIENTELCELKVKLYCQKIMCLVALEKSVDDALSKAKSELRKIQNKSRRKDLGLVVDKVEAAVSNYVFKDSLKTKNSADLLEILNNKEKEDFSKSLIIEYNSNDGRHLVAARDFKPGEIINVQTPYVSNSNTEILPYSYCMHCLKVGWFSIPCSFDGWGFFCSQECEKKAWEEYHDIECSVWARVNDIVECHLWRQLTVRTIIKALKETGSIAKLKATVKEINECTDKSTKGFSKTGQFESNSFRGLYSLSGQSLTKMSQVHAADAVKVLIAFIKCSTIFGKKNKFKNIEEILADDEVIFIGTLILRLFSIFSLNFQEIAEINPRCGNNHDIKLCWETRCCYRATCMSPLFSLINHSCDPNAAITMTDNGKLMLYALKPIKKNSQILRSYYGVGTFYNKNKSDRKCMTETIHSFICNCKACQKSWPVLEKLKENDSSKKVTPEVLKKINDLIESVEQKKVRLDQNIATELGKAIEAVSSENSQPSRLTCKLINALIKVYDKIYLTRLNMPKHCSENP